jgi:hypothetical protein
MVLHRSSHSDVAGVVTLAEKACAAGLGDGLGDGTRAIVSSSELLLPGVSSWPWPVL